MLAPLRPPLSAIDLRSGCAQSTFSRSRIMFSPPCASLSVKASKNPVIAVNSLSNWREPRQTSAESVEAGSSPPPLCRSPIHGNDGRGSLAHKSRLAARLELRCSSPPAQPRGSSAGPPFWTTLMSTFGGEEIRHGLATTPLVPGNQSGQLTGSPNWRTENSAPKRRRKWANFALCSRLCQIRRG